MLVKSEIPVFITLSYIVFIQKIDYYFVSSWLPLIPKQFTFWYELSTWLLLSSHLFSFHSKWMNVLWHPVFFKPKQYFYILGVDYNMLQIFLLFCEHYGNMLFTTDSQKHACSMYYVCSRYVQNYVRGKYCFSERILNIRCSLELELGFAGEWAQCVGSK